MDLKTYIDGSKFQFITDFSKHACINTNGEESILDFGNLSVYERIMLSSYLTILCDENISSFKKQNIYDKIFNFNSNLKYQIYYKTSYHDQFLNDLTVFLKDKPIYFSYIKDNFNKIKDNKTFIYRSQLNASEMSLLYDLKFQRSYKSLMNVLYIMGVSKQNIQTVQLNQISLMNFYSSVSMSKKRVEQIFAKLNTKSTNKILYKIDNNIVYFSSGFNIEQDEKYFTPEQIEFNKNSNAENILNSFINKSDENIQEIKQETITFEKQKINDEEFGPNEIIEDDEPIDLYKMCCDSPDALINNALEEAYDNDTRLDEKLMINIVDSMRRNNEMNYSNNYVQTGLKTIKDENLNRKVTIKLCNLIDKEIRPYVDNKCKNLLKLLRNQHVDNYGEVRDAAKQEQLNLSKHCSKVLNEKMNEYIDNKYSKNDICNKLHLIICQIINSFKEHFKYGYEDRNLGRN